MVDKANIVSVLFEICRGSNQDVNRPGESKELLVKLLGSPPTMDAFRHDH
jgi:hypothetical protein